MFVPDRFGDWSLNGAVTRLGLRFPANQNRIQITSVESGPFANTFPLVSSSQVEKGQTTGGGTAETPTFAGRLSITNHLQIAPAIPSLAKAFGDAPDVATTFAREERTQPSNSASPNQKFPTVNPLEQCVKSGEIVEVAFDGSTIDGARKVRLYFTKPGQSLSTETASVPVDPNAIAYEIVIPTTKGVLEIPVDLLDRISGTSVREVDTARYKMVEAAARTNPPEEATVERPAQSRFQVGLVSLDDNAEPIGFLSDPVMINLVRGPAK